MSKALVTGANGFVGSHLVEYLLNKGYEVRCLVRKTSNLRWLSGLNVEYHYGDARDKSSLVGAFKGCNYVFHVAGVTRGTSRKLYFDANLSGTQNVIETCLNENTSLKRFVYISSQAAVGPNPDQNPLDERAPCHPITPYGQSKLEAEKTVLQYKNKIPVTIIRPPTVYGPRDDELFFVFKMIKCGIKPQIGFRDTLVSVCYIGDLIEGILLSAESEKSIGQTYFIADDRVYSWKEATDMIAKSLERKAISIRFPKSILFLSAYFSEMFAKLSKKQALLNRYKAKELSQSYWICDISKAISDLGFVPKVKLEEGSKETAEWYKLNKWL
ncbi:MAG TPA: NAD-dependent epimerase/dehydratase family protein [candidate division Zixibacteria bacterium]